NDIRIDHAVDTQGGNSGSPIIWEQMNIAIGIHTNDGCQSERTGTNAGPSCGVDALENAISRFPGSQPKYSDQRHPLRFAEEGTLFRPFTNIGPAIAATPNGGIVSMVLGFYYLTRRTALH